MANLTEFSLDWWHPGFGPISLKPGPEAAHEHHNMAAIVIEIPPVAEPLSLAEMKLHLGSAPGRSPIT